MSVSKIMMAMIVGCCVVGMTLAEPAAKPEQREQRQRQPAVEKQTNAEQGSFSGRVVQMTDEKIVVRNRMEKMTFRPLRPKVKAPEELAVGSFVKVEWAVAGKGKRIDKIEKMDRPNRPGAAVQGNKKGEGKGQGKGDKMQKRDGSGEGKGQGKGKCKDCPKAAKE